MHLPWTRRLAATATAVALLGAGPAIPAAAEGNGEAFSAGQCNYYLPSPDSQFSQTTKEPLQVAWQIKRLAPEAAWPLATGKGVTVGVIDTGVDNIDMLYFDNARVKTVNFAPKDPRQLQQTGLDCTHGTKVVSLIAGRRSIDPAANFSGIAPAVKVISYRALQFSEPPKDGDLEPFEPTVKAVRQAIKDGVDIINISQSAPSDNAAYRAAITAAIKAGIVVVAAAGNAGHAGPSYPAAYPGVIAVAMTTRADTAHELSQWGRGMTISVAAPGDQVLALMPSRKASGLAFEAGDGATGTSFAAPLVTGLAALILERYPNLSPAQVKHRLEATADPPPGAVPDPKLGYGIVNPYRALTMAISDEQQPTQSPTQVEPPQHPDDRPKPDNTVRNIAIGVAGGIAALTLLGFVLHMSFPAARARRFQPAQIEPHRPATDDPDSA